MTEQILFKRLVFFTQILAILSIVSVVGLIQWLGSRRFQQDLDDLNLLETTSKARSQTYADSPEVLLGVREELEKHDEELEKRDSDLHNDRLRVREDLTHWLGEQGVPNNVLENLEGKVGGGSIDPGVPFFVIEVEGDRASLEKGATGFVSREVRSALELLEEQTKPREIRVATNFNVEGVELWPGEGYRLTGVRLRGDQIEVMQEEKAPLQQQRPPATKTVLLDARVEHLRPGGPDPGGQGVPEPRPSFGDERHHARG